ncbi:oligosaccharide repeat unit polymerase [Ewingella sp. CoE-038-23]|uniref:oligosaccharide repeat unit polymerase n=1 Tax=Ewingella docleensis TaxID=3118588 RepID=UPI0033655A8C
MNAKNENPNRNTNVLKYSTIYIVVLASLLFVFLENTISAVLFKSTLDVLAVISTALFCYIMVYFYINRAKYFSMQLLFAFIFSMIIGLPAVYLYFFKDANSGFELVCVWGILINIVLYLTAINGGVVQQKNKINAYFKNIFFLVSFCQVIKVGVYLKFILSSGLGHLAIYTEGEELLSNVPFIVRAISGLSLVMSLAIFYYDSPKKFKVIAFTLLLSELLIGIRSKFFFSLICVIVLSLYVNKEKVKRVFLIISRPQYLFLGFTIFSLISYFREGYQINFIDYLVVVLDSLSSTLAGLQNLYSLPMSQGWGELHSVTIFTQILPLSGFGFLNDNQIYKDFSIIVLGDISSGIALSSSGILESSILSLNFNVVIYLSYLLIVMSMILKGLNSKLTFVNFIAIAMLPGFFYSVRGELILPFAYIIKSLPIIMVSPFLISKSSSER